jgi:hypothetical protein
MTDYHKLSIDQIIDAKPIVGYQRAIKFMLNHELNTSPTKFGIDKANKIAIELGNAYQNLKSMRLPNNSTRRRIVAEEAYLGIYDKYIRPLKINKHKTLSDLLDE